MWPSHSSQHPAMFAVHRPCKEGDITFSYLPGDHMIEVPGDFAGAVLSS